MDMTAKLSQELADALHASGAGELEVIDPTTSRVYVVVDSQTHQAAMAALRRQQDHDAIAEGIAQMEAGQGKPLDEAFEGMRERLGFPQRA
jgi:prophage DNA circulation protein